MVSPAANQTGHPYLGERIMPILDYDSPQIAAFDDFVRHSPYARCPQDRQWSQVKQNWDSHFVYLESEGHITAAMSVLSLKVANGKRLFYANRGPVCDFYDTDLVTRLIAEATPLIRERDGFLLRLDPEVRWDGELVSRYRDLGYVFRSRETDLGDFIQPRFNMILPLSPNTTPAELMAEFNQKTRYNIRLSQRKGCTTQYYSWQSHREAEVLAAIDKFYELTEIMAQRNSITYRNKAYFVGLIRAFPQSRIYLTFHEGEALSAAIAVPYNQKLFYMYGASSNEKRNLMPNYNMQWEMIQWGLELGMAEYDFGGVFRFVPEDGLFRFKNGFCHTCGPTEFIGELDVVFDESAYEQFKSTQHKTHH
ncbi:peptidoglycan bridge formation glycyltransferase FemA/FemB family protein [Mobiluncus mulieris]|nr:peptidoglycan bridge formation glycyltransferase FemA/FemB family protein [Mobiluncus mulieris]